MPIVATSAKGQVVIPKKEREKLGMKPGAKVIVKAVSDHIEIYPLLENPVEYFCGFYKKGSSLTHALLKDRKKEAGRELKRGAGSLCHSGIPEKRR
jgi:AbrB family looped-hinge helix DNA binding protein